MAALCGASAPTQQPDATAVIRAIDAANQARYDNVLSFTDIEHYAVYRGEDETHPAAEMTVLDSYRRGVGKTYTIQSKSGSSLIFRFGLKPMLEQERTINEPANLPHSWFISANYEMKPQLGTTVKMNGRDCVAVPVTARVKAPNTINGTIWVDAKDYWLVQIEGLSSKSPSAFAGDTHLMRQYTQDRRLFDGRACARGIDQRADRHERGHHRIQQLQAAAQAGEIRPPKPGLSSTGAKALFQSIENRVRCVYRRFPCGRMISR